MKAKSWAALAGAGLLLWPQSPVLAIPPAQSQNDDRMNSMDEDDSRGSTPSLKGEAAARQKLKEAQDALSRGALGFYEYIRDKGDAHMLDAQGAINHFGDGILDEWTEMGARNDATSLENMKATLPLLARCNELRARHGVQPLKVSLSLTAIEQKQLNWSKTNMTHALKYGNATGNAWIGELLAWGPSDPYTGWYSAEKEQYEQYLEEGLSDGEIRATYWKKVGHYLTLICPDYASTGFALSQTDTWPKVSGQAVNRVDTGYSVEEYARLLDEYCAMLQQRIDAAREELREYGVVMYRLYNTNSGEHFYTGDVKEYEQLKKAGWKDEGTGWIAPRKSSLPVYRLYNANEGDHHYTMSQNERRNLIRAGWKDEGIGWYSEEEELTPLYRQYSRTARCGAHHYTTDQAEAYALVEAGWKDEGIAWYGM